MTSSTGNIEQASTIPVLGVEISCTAVYIENASNRASGFISGIHTLYVAEDGEDAWISFRTLLAHLHAILAGPTADRLPGFPAGSVLGQIILGQHPTALNVATTRVPNFDLGSHQDPGNGYRNFGRLDISTIGLAFPTMSMPGTEDILSFDQNSSDPVSANFVRLWRRFLPRLNRHFFLIFTEVQPVADLRSRLLLHTWNSNSASSSSYAGSGTSSPAPPSNHSLPSVAPYTPSQPAFINFLSNIHPQPHQPLRFSNDESYEPIPNGTLEASHTAHSDVAVSEETSCVLTPDVALTEVFTALSISQALVVAATVKHGGSQQLFTLVQNYRSMSSLLVALGLQSGERDPDAHSLREFPGGLRLTSRYVLESLGWSLPSWKKKSYAYSWAEAAACLVWTHPIPTAAADPEYKMYRTWKGIVYMFRPGGALDRGELPSSSSMDPDERLAAGLKQSMIFTPERTALAQVLGSS